MSVEKALL